MVELLGRDFDDHHRYQEAQNPIAATWLISFRQIEDHDTLAADYLKFMCFLSEKAIPRSLLPHDTWSLKAEDVIGTLKSYAFITEREQSNICDIHRLVRLAMLNWLDKQCELEKWTVNVIRRLGETFPVRSYDNRGEWISYLPHTRYVIESGLTTEDGKGGPSFQNRMRLRDPGPV